MNIFNFVWKWLNTKKRLIKIKSKFKFTTLILILSFSPDLEEYMIQISDWEFGTMPQNDAL